MKIKLDVVFKYILICLIILFMIIYVSYKNGYLAYTNYKKSILTAEKIRQFEDDVANGRAIDIDNYLEEEKDYNNNISRISLNISNTVGRYIKKSIIFVLKKVNKLIE